MKGFFVSWCVILAAFAPAVQVEASSFEHVMMHYEPIRAALIADSMEGVAEHGEKILVLVTDLERDLSATHAGVKTDGVATVRAKLPEMITAARALAGASNLAEAREALYALSKPLVHWREVFTGPDRPAVAYCSMHKKSWLQPGGEIGNPYGDMPRCGTIVSK
jgi:hypothetical protein